MKSLAQQSATGWLREGFGFVPRAAYFGGLTTEQSGFTNMFCWDPFRSVFAAARQWSEQEAQEVGLNLRAYVEETARDRLTPFSKAYLMSAEIPLEYIWYFDLVEKKAPWDKDVGYKSLFALLQDAGMRWYECSWPLTNNLPDPSDGGIVARTLADLKPEHRFAYVHLQKLDAIGHVHGPGSREMRQQIQVIDGLCEKLIEGLRARYEDLDVVLFGDHGMVTVTGTVDLWGALEKTGLKFGIDYGYFLDSSMARFWFFHQRARRIVEQALQGLRGGHVLSQQELEHHGIARCDQRNGEMYFLADPGVLIFPNFFQRQGKPIKGMHGYDPNCPDNYGYFLLHSTRQKAWGGKRIGQVDPPELFGLCSQLIGLQGTTPPKVLNQISEPPPAGCFTQHPDPEAHKAVERHLARIMSAVVEEVGKPTAILLMGSFGRGEGGVYRDKKGCYRPVNDYDILVVHAPNCEEKLKALGNKLATELGIDYVDLAWSQGCAWQDLPVSIQHFDLKYGTRVLAGDPQVLDSIPAYTSSEIPIYESIKLLLNRSAGLLTGLRGEFLAGRKLDDDQRRYMTNQVVKALMALGDSFLIRWGEYDASYQRRGNRIKWMGTGAGLTSATLDKILAAYCFKLHPDYEASSMAWQSIAEFYPEMETALCEAIAIETGAPRKPLEEAMDAHLQFLSNDAKTVADDNARSLANQYMQTVLLPGIHPAVSLRHLIYSALPFLVIAAVDSKRSDWAMEQVVRRLQARVHLAETGGEQRKQVGSPAQPRHPGVVRCLPLTP